MMDRFRADPDVAYSNERWVADFAYVATWSGIVYVAFVVDVFSRAIVGWSASASKRAKLVLDALDMALWRRDRAGTPAGPGLVHHSDAGSQYTSFAFTAHLLEAGIDASIGTVGDALDNALMESHIGLYKTELIKERRPWHGLADVELVTAEWGDWFNNQRIHTAIGDIPPHEHETNYYAQHQPQPAAGANTMTSCRLLWIRRYLPAVRLRLVDDDGDFLAVELAPLVQARAKVRLHLPQLPSPPRGETFGLRKPV
ncbi:IS3 family transposase [Streptomyces lunaelactis]|nr:IS3 family transposase [Streptomyces lunaelactis]NUK41884.1 IS3 family transposase [Streptomyces lunaelactis]NUK92220.1 IS3 family transposase [Streptomyces lunaelactis]NUL32049.1 IS3 family transposase [Streptomyces lunaelactis]